MNSFTLFGYRVTERILNRKSFMSLIRYEQSGGWSSPLDKKKLSLSTVDQER